MAGAATLGMGLLLFKEATFKVAGGERAIIFNKLNGVGDAVYSEGVHFKIPYLENAIIIDVRTRPSTIPIECTTKDLVNVKLKVRVLHRPDPIKLKQAYQAFGDNPGPLILPSITTEVVKRVTSEIDAREMLINRTEMSRTIAK